MVVMEWPYSDRASPSFAGGGGGVGEGDGCALDVVRLPSHPPPLFIGARERGAGPLQMDLEGGSGQGGMLAPQVKGGAPFRVPPNPRRMGPKGGGIQPTKGLVPLHTQPIGPSGAGGPSRWTPGTPSVVPVQYR